MKASIRKEVFEKFGGKCAYCGCDLMKGWHVDHLKPVLRAHKFNYEKRRMEQTKTMYNPQNDVIENYNPSCASCNIQKNSYSIEEFRSNIKHFIKSLNNHSTQYKFAKRYGLVEEKEVEVKFYFETQTPC